MTALLLLGSAAASATPAGAKEPPDSPDLDIPEHEWRDLVTPNILAYQEGLELEVAVMETGDQELATMLDDYVFDYDEGCWEEFGERAHPVWLDAATRVRADHRLSTTEVELQAHFPDGGGPFANLFPDPGEEEVLWKARDPSLLPAYSLNEEDLEVAAGIQEVGDEGTPMTSGAVDLRYMDESAVAEVISAIGDALRGAGGVQIETGPAGVTMTGKNIDAQMVAAEFQAAGGVPQICLKPTMEMCLDPRWHDSWCGRQAFEEHGADPTWICAEALQDSVDDFVMQNGGAVGPILEPEATYQGGTRLEHVGNVRASGLTIPLLPDSAYMESNEGSSPTELKAANVSARAAKVAGWASNNGTFSCEEFAFEYHQDASNLDEAAKAHHRDPQWIFDVVMFGRDGLGPHVDGANRFEPDFRTDAGSRIWYLDNDSPMGGDFGFVPWERYGIGSALPDPDMPHRIKGEYDVHYPGRYRYRTFKNVYYYLHRLRKGSGDEFEGTCVDYKDELYNHYRPSMVWHYGMDRTAKQEGFLVDEMERMRRKQDALWKLYEDYSLSEDPSHREELTQRIDAALREGYASGCIPMDPNQPTACDWAPSLLVDGLMERVHYFREADEAACEAELGPEPQSNASIREKFVEIPWRAEHDAAAYQDVVDRRNDALSWPFTSGAGPFGRYLHLMNGSDRVYNPGYRDLVVDLFSASGVRDALMSTFEEKRSIDGEFFGAGFEAFGQSTANLEVARACDPVPFNTAEGAVQVSLGGARIDVLSLTGTAGPKELFVDVLVSNNLVWMPGGGFQNCHSAAVQGGWNFFEVGDSLAIANLGFGELVVGFQASGNVSATAGGRYCHTDHALMPIPEEQLIPNGDSPCGEATTTESSFEMSLGGRIDGYAYLAVQVLKILRFGVKGSMTLVSLDMPTTWSTVTTTDTPDRRPKTTDRRRTVLKLKLASGKLSVFVDLDLRVAQVEVFDLLLVNWHGLHLDKPLADTEGEYDLCMTTEIGLIGAGSVGAESDPCPCRFRPANCHDDEDEGDA